MLGKSPVILKQERFFWIATFQACSPSPRTLSESFAELSLQQWVKFSPLLSFSLLRYGVG